MYAYLAIAALVILLVYFPTARYFANSGNSAAESRSEEAKRLEQAREKMRQGIDLNRQQEFDLAADCFREALDLAPEDFEPHYWLMLYHEEKARQGQQADQAQEMLKHTMMSGFHARALVPHLHSMIPANQDFVAEAIYNESKGHMLLGDQDAALAALDLAVKCGYAQRAEIDGEAIFDPLREQTAFQRIVASIKLPESP